ncbi:hypothetical protein K493DRAFT_313476 [Basidiobolus meristosporus CBS 931.73]|uniref:Uncharacterized protein n=1 Tax=Basidiobolus meristosporus CBS 931.73 TaxID=1314790 RepID=A0A1Y1YMP7_9FUNG|nr:hypothetical protein K493DRAFT_313476 [Basidiobolus meristosporus CBS 931.73]|eukprot:ORX98844.1 hypothetical protein K493DRAFT_313476 [Basidiobolus meristosporus CBS 931.73]
MFPLAVSAAPFSKRPNQAFDGLNNIIKYHTDEQTPGNPKSLGMARFQNLASQLEEKRETVGLIHGLDVFTQDLDREIVDNYVSIQSKSTRLLESMQLLRIDTHLLNLLLPWLGLRWRTPPQWEWF